MGFFDGKVIELGQKLSSNLEMRANVIEEKRQVEKDVGQKYTMAITINILREVAGVIRETTKE